jgi:hypothetical protein
MSTDTRRVRSSYVYANTSISQAPPNDPRTAGAEFDAWLAEHDARVWDEGYHAGVMDEFRHQAEHAPNPYRADAMTRQADETGVEVVEDRQPYQGPTTDLIMAGHDMSLAPHYPGPGQWCEACPTPAELVVPEPTGTCDAPSATHGVPCLLERGHGALHRWRHITWDDRHTAPAADDEHPLVLPEPPDRQRIGADWDPVDLDGADDEGGQER